MNAVIDAGGTHTRIGFSENLKEFKDVVKFDTPKTLHEFTKNIKEALDQYAHLERVILGVAGFIDHHKNQIIKAPHIPYLDGKHVKEIFDEKHTDLYVENDAALAGLAEAVMGEGIYFTRLAYITISTGVGGTLVVEKRLPRTRFNYEPGHHIINFHGEEHALHGVKGSWESFSSGTGFSKRYGVNPVDHHDEKLWKEYGEILAVGLHNITMLWQPDGIVLGGSMSKKSHLFLKVVKDSLAKTLHAYVPEIKISNLGDTNGLSGGLEFLKNLR